MSVSSDSASCGVPVTVTAKSNPTWTEIVSPAPYDPPIAGWLTAATDETVGAVVLPFTLWPAAFAMAWPAKLSVAFAAVALWIVPPFKVRALPPTPIPSASTSVAPTT